MTSIMHPQAGFDHLGRYRETWTDPAVEDIRDRLWHGDPSLGWEGDPNLNLVLESDGAGGSRWALERLESDGNYHVVCRSRPGADVRGLIKVLVEHDRQRGYDLAAELIASDEKRRKDELERQSGALAEKLDKVVWAINRDTHGGVHSLPVLPRISRVSATLGE